GSFAELPSGFSRFVAVNGALLCELPSNALALMEPETPTDLQIGPAWWTALLDWTCDGTFDEWNGLCPTDPAQLAEWCAIGADPSDPCAASCDPVTGNGARR